MFPKQSFPQMPSNWRFFDDDPKMYTYLSVMKTYNLKFPQSSTWG